MKYIDNEIKQIEIYKQVKELRAIRTLLNNNKEHLAFVELEKLIEKYPKNYTIKLEYAKLLSKSNMNNQALFILNNLEHFYLNKFSDVEKFTLYYRMLLLYFYNKEYDKVINYYSKVLKYSKYGEFNQKEFRCFLLYSLKKLNKLKNINKSRLRYTERQVIDYSKDKAIEHIKLHLEKFNKYANEALFNNNIDIEELYTIATEKIKTSKKNGDSYGLDIYQFKYKNIGTFNGKIRDVLEVVCIADTFDIISMYPVDNFDPNLEDLIAYDFSDIKKPSQIEKFKTKYKDRV